MIKYIVLLSLIVNSIFSYSQKKTFDIVSYNEPARWTPKQGNDYFSYSKIDGSSWAQIAIYQHRISEGDIQKDFDKDWKELVAATSRDISAPEKTSPQSAEGWTVMSGSGVWQFNGANVASILTIYSNNKVCVSILCNATAQPYLKDYQTLIGSLDLDASKSIETPIGSNNSSTANSNSSMNAIHSSLAGLWCDNILETSGYLNGYPQYTAGYFRKEYSFNADGTYVFRIKNWSVYMKDILFTYETGTYSISGNQLTIAPTQGKGEWWSKATSGKTNEWGTLLKASDYKLEKVTYAFEIKYYSGTQNYSLILKSGKATQRENSQQTETQYAQRLGPSLIDNPPGFKAGSENKPDIAQSLNPSSASTSISGTWSQSSSGNYAGQLVSGYVTMQYVFNNDGTYSYVSKTFSQSMSYIIFSKENGRYVISGNRLTVTPSNGVTQSWTRKTDATGTGDKWGELIKEEKRSLENTVYTFTLHYFEGIKEQNLVLQNSKETLRDGKYSTNTLYQNAWYYKPISNSNPKIELPSR